MCISKFRKRYEKGISNKIFSGRRILRLYFLFSCSVLILSAQSANIDGTVIDISTNKPIADVNVYLENSRLGTTTDRQGKFKISDLTLGQTAILTFSHLGYEIFTTKIAIDKKSISKNIILKPRNIHLGEISVLSSRYSKILKDNPQPLEVMNRKDFEINNGISIPDFLQYEPGISLRRDGIWGTDLNIRGLSKDNVITLIDGNRIETASEIAAAFSLIDVNDIERVEVLKGACSSLYGSGAVGGVVNIFSKQSSYSENFYINGSVQSSFNTVNNGSYSSINIFAGAETWHLKLASSIRSAKDIETPQGIMANSRFHDNNISALFAAKLSDSQEMTINFQRSRATDVGIPGGSSFPVAADVKYPEEKRDLLSVNYSFQNISNSLIKLNLKYFYQYIFRDVENIPHTVKELPAGETTPPKRVSVLSITPSADHITHGLQLQTDFIFGSHYLITGIDLWRRSYRGEREKNQLIEVLNSSTGEVINTSNITIGEKPLPNSNFTSIGIYLQDDISISNSLQLTAGARIDKILINNNKTLNPVYQITNGTRNDSPANQVVIWEKSNAENTSWSINLSTLYKLEKEIELTITGARSFRSPSLEERYQYIDLGSYVRLGNPDLNPEEGYFMDAGLRYWGDNFTMKGNVFLNYLTNLVVEKAGEYEGRIAYIKTNIGEARLYGFDLSGQLNINELKLRTTVAYVRGEDTYSNKNLPQIAPLNGTLELTLPLIDLADISVSSSFFAEQNKISNEETATPGYAIFNINCFTKVIQAGLVSLNFYAGVENIFNKLYRNHLATNRSFITAEPGRNFYLKVKLNW